MKFYYNFSFLGKGLAALFTLMLLSNVSNAQTATVYNFTSCVKIVKLTAINSGCTNTSCSQTFTVPPTGGTPVSLSIMGCTDPIVLVEIEAGANCPYAPSPSIALATPGCACSGATNDAGSFTVGGTTVNASSTCSGSDVTVAIW